MFKSKSSRLEKHYSILIDTDTNAVLAVSEHTYSALFLSECMFNTQARFGVNFPNYVDSLLGTFFLANADSQEYINWTWHGPERKFIKTKPEDITDELKARANLAMGKLKTIENVLKNINSTRLKIMTTLHFQDQIYAEKRAQALAFKKSGYNDDILLECPYVTQYATLEKISPRQAADDILLKAEISSQYLASTELLRLHYSNLIKKAATKEELKKISNDFMADIYYNP